MLYIFVLAKLYMPSYTWRYMSAPVVTYNLKKLCLSLRLIKHSHRLPGASILCCFVSKYCKVSNMGTKGSDRRHFLNPGPVDTLK